MLGDRGLKLNYPTSKIMVAKNANRDTGFPVFATKAQSSQRSTERILRILASLCLRGPSSPHIIKPSVPNVRRQLCMPVVALWDIINPEILLS